MSCTTYERRTVKTSTVEGEVPTIPVSSDHRNGDWIPTDIYKGEWFFNSTDGTMYTRGENGIVTIIGSGETHGNLVFVDDLSKLPEPVSDVITLLDGYSYLFTLPVDLLGSRIVSGENSVIVGLSSENCSITSTGLDSATALVTSEYTMPMRFITIKDVGTSLDFDGTTNTVALDWTGVNFQDVDTVGVINNCSNFIFNKGAFLTAKGLTFTGTSGTIALENSIFIGDGGEGALITLDSGLTLTRRFRANTSSIVAFGGDVGILVEEGATIPDESFILDNINFSGGGTYLSGIDASSNKALISRCNGIDNSSTIGQYYMIGNAITTVIVGSDTPTKVLGITIEGALTSKFDCDTTDNRGIYTGALSDKFKCDVVLSASSGNNNDLSFYIYKNDVQISESVSKTTTDGFGDSNNVSIHSVSELNPEGYLEVWAENNSDSGNITVTDMNVIITKL